MGTLHRTMEARFENLMIHGYLAGHMIHGLILQVSIFKIIENIFFKVYHFDREMSGGNHDVCLRLRCVHWALSEDHRDATVSVTGRPHGTILDWKTLIRPCTCFGCSKRSKNALEQLSLV